MFLNLFYFIFYPFFGLFMFFLHELAAETIKEALSEVIPKVSYHTKLIKIDHLAAILPEVTCNTLVLIDLDETLITSSLLLGTPACWQYFKDYANQKKIPIDQNLIFPLPIIHQICQRVPIQVIEKEAAAFITSLQQKGITVWGLTARYYSAPWDPKFALLTQQQLNTWGIDFNKSPLVAPSLSTNQNFPTNYANGIIFTNHQLKGPILIDFLKKINFYPKKVIVIDDQENQLHSIAEALKKEGISFTGFHYTRLTSAYQNFDPLIVNIQLYYLLDKGVILNDCEAQNLKEFFLKKENNSHFFIEKLFKQIQ